MKMEENKKKRIRLTDNSALVWQQRHGDKSVHSNTVRDDSVLYRTARAAKEAEDRSYAEKAEQNRQPRVSDAEKERREVVRREAEKIDVRNNLMRQERRLGIEGALSFDDISRAQESGLYVGRSKPMELKKRDVRGLGGKTKRKRHSAGRLLPSERRRRLSRARIERNRKKVLEKTAKKELYITDAKGQKISVSRLRKLRGLQKDQAITKRDTDFAKKYQMSKRREQESGRTALRIRKRDEYTR